jgi:hypothetical protein
MRNCIQFLHSVARCLDLDRTAGLRQDYGTTGPRAAAQLTTINAKRQAQSVRAGLSENIGPSQDRDRTKNWGLTWQSQSGDPRRLRCVAESYVIRWPSAVGTDQKDKQGPLAAVRLAPTETVRLCPELVGTLSARR